jgi:hypothetical protein
VCIEMYLASHQPLGDPAAPIQTNTHPLNLVNSSDSWLASRIEPGSPTGSGSGSLLPFTFLFSFLDSERGCRGRRLTALPLPHAQNYVHVPKEQRSGSIHAFDAAGLSRELAS